MSKAFFIVNGKRFSINETPECVASLNSDDEFTLAYFTHLISKGYLARYDINAKTVEELTIDRIEKNRAPDNADNNIDIFETNDGESVAIASEVSSNECNDNDVDCEGTAGLSSDKRAWFFDETILLITCVEAHFEDFDHPTKRKRIWEDISNEMISNHVSVTSTICSQKWKNLLRTYKNCKDKLNKSGRGVVRFKFFERMDEFLSTKPNISNPHGIDASTLNCTITSIENSENIQEKNEQKDDESLISKSNDSNKLKGRKNPRTEYFNAKTAYLRKKQQDLKQKREKRELYLQEKIELERRKVQALEELVTLRKEKFTINEI